MWAMLTDALCWNDTAFWFKITLNHFNTINVLCWNYRAHFHLSQTINVLSYLKHSSNKTCNVNNAGFLLKLCEWQFLALFQTGGYEDQQLAVKHRRAAKAPQALLALQVWAGGASFSPGPPHCRTDVLFSLWPSQWQRQAAGSWANSKHVRSFWGLFNP